MKKKIEIIPQWAQWVGAHLHAHEDGIPYMVIGKDKTGISCLIGGAVKINMEKTIVTAIRETSEETGKRIFAREIKKLWRGEVPIEIMKPDLNFIPGTITYKKVKKNLRVEMFSCEIPFFKGVKLVQNDPSIVEIQMFPISYVLSYLMFEKTFNVKDCRILKKMAPLLTSKFLLVA